MSDFRQKKLKVLDQPRHMSCMAARQATTYIGEKPSPSSSSSLAENIIPNAVMVASKNGNLNTLKYLVENKADIHIKNNYCVRRASRNGHIDAVKYLVKHKADIHMKNNYCVRWASKNGHLEVVKYLVKHKADIHIKNNYCVRWASKNGHLEVVKYLVKHKADVHADDNYCVKWASENGHLEVVKYLVENKVDIHANDNQCVRWASENGHLEVVKYLVENKADIHAGDSGSVKSASSNGHLEVVKYLAENKADIHAEDNYCIRTASEYGHINTVKYLVENKADIHVENNLCIRWASENGHIDTVKYLVENKADILSKDNYCVRWASENGHLEVVKYLVKHKADIYVEDNYCVRVASENGHLDVVKYLVEHKADIQAENNDSVGNNKMEAFYATSDTVVDVLTKHGVAIIPSVLTEKECIDLHQGMWNALETLTSTLEVPLKQSDTKTWAKGLTQLFPLHSMLIQQHGHVQAIWDVRQNHKVADIFGHIFDTDANDMLVSFDGFAVHLPPEVTKKGWFHNSWLHADQEPVNASFVSVQGWVTALPVRNGDATLHVMQGSHLFHKERFEKFGGNMTQKEQKTAWNKLGDGEEEWLLAKGCKHVYIECPAGSLVLWDSRTVHAGREPLKNRVEPNERCVVYTSYLPRSQATPKQLIKKQKAFNEGRSTTHNAIKCKLFPKQPRTYGKPPPVVKKLPSPVLTPLGRRLAGFE